MLTQTEATNVFPFDNSYARLPERFFARLPPTPVAAPRLIRLNEALARHLRLDPEQLSSAEGVAVLAGNRVPQSGEPLAMAYAGHQFGAFVPQLGDGRAILLGEVVDADGIRRDIQLKGSGPTPFSRNGDGRAALGPVLREYIVSEAMAALGVPTTRSLAAVATGEIVRREMPLPGAVLTRVASSHIRVGTFQYFAVRGDVDALRDLADGPGARLWLLVATTPVQMKEWADAFGVSTTEFTRKWVRPDADNDAKRTDIRKILEGSDPTSTQWKDIYETLRGIGIEKACLCKAILDDDLAEFFVVMAKAAGKKLVELSEVEKLKKDGEGDDKKEQTNGSKPAVGWGDATAPPLASRYVGIRWPDIQALEDNCGGAYREVFGGARNERNFDRDHKGQVFFFYRLGLTPVTDDRERHSLGMPPLTDIRERDGTITLKDKVLRRVLRRIPVRIFLKDREDKWLSYEETYWNGRLSRLFKAEGVLYGFKGGMTLLARDGTVEEGSSAALNQKLSMAHFDFRPALAKGQQFGSYNRAGALKYFTGSIAMEADFNPNPDDSFSPTAYRCLLRKAPTNITWAEAQAESKDIPGLSATVPLSHKCTFADNEEFDFGDGSMWQTAPADSALAREMDIQYDGHSHSWRWYFNRLNINRHVADLLIASPAMYSRKPAGGYL